MGRSVKKGPYCDFRLAQESRSTMEKSGKKSVIKTWSQKINHYFLILIGSHIRCA